MDPLCAAAPTRSAPFSKPILAVFDIAMSLPAGMLTQPHTGSISGPRGHGPACRHADRDGGSDCRARPGIPAAGARAIETHETSERPRLYGPTAAEEDDEFDGEDDDFDKDWHSLEGRWPKSEFASCNELGPKLNPPAFVHGKNCDGGSPGRGETHNQGPLKLKVLVPVLLPRVEESLDIPGCWVNP
jgi:hypothetical protein